MDTNRRYTAGSMPGTSGFTMACFEAKDVPVGTVIYTEAQVMGLVEAMEELLPIAISSESNGPVERARISEAREALSKFRGEV